jgi:hypothetical protein
MLAAMNRSRLTTWGGVALLALVVVAAACTAKQQNGEECLKNFDCESDRCIQYICVDPNASRAPTTVTDSGAADTAPADTGPADTGMASESGGDAAETSAETATDASGD